MIDKLQKWAKDHSISPFAIDELIAMFAPNDLVAPVKGMSEQAVKAAVRLEAASKGIHLWINNVGAFIDSRGVQVRYGLANDSKRLNSIFKSADLIGIRPILIGPEHLGLVIGQFVARECKQASWSYKGNDHELAQMAFLRLVSFAGGDASFCNGTGSL